MTLLLLLRPNYEPAVDGYDYPASFGLRGKKKKKKRGTLEERLKEATRAKVEPVIPAEPEPVIARDPRITEQAFQWARTSLLKLGEELIARLRSDEAKAQAIQKELARQRLMAQYEEEDLIIAQLMDLI